MNNPVNLPKPIKFSVQVKWSFGKTNCPNKIGCPLLDPRSGLTENVNFVVVLQSGLKKYKIGYQLNILLILIHFKLEIIWIPIK